MGSGEGHIGPVQDSAGAGCQALLSALLPAQIRPPGSPMRWALVVSAVLLRKCKMGGRCAILFVASQLSS